ncbi:hypothetical protein [Enhygromyxa salina]|uniref:Endo-1,4-beta-xylanase A n=1 Tax=Enhygromyxa salina TaxID=215803 RepID=A0A2S9XNJ6_9BACT|nr:hypothetical protein [Enhygromyxa salina]PRP94300.1 hypothetical protein ENSA7_78370 [Enhygromyxa salina]
MLSRSLAPVTCALLLIACGGNGDADSLNADSNTTPGTNTTPAETSDGNSNSNSNGDGDGDAGDGDPGDGDPGDGDGDPGDGDADSDGGIKFDLPGLPDAGAGNCEGMGGADPEFSYIWVANSNESTISKVNTETLLEEGRYRTRGDGNGSPSRTSVNLSGDVAVANRNGGLTKVIALHENCDEMTNGQPGLQTSTGKNDVLAWGQDDCISWYTAVNPAYTSQRPLAWTSGVLNPNTCTVEDQFLWSTASTSGQPGSLHVMMLDGVDGSIDEEFPIPEISPGFFGGYGGAVNSENDYWFITYDSPRKLVKVDFENLDYQLWDVPQSVCSYGFTVDSLDRPWIGAFCDGSAMFDPETEQFTVLPGLLGYGLQEDANKTMWLGTFSPPGLRAIDIETLQPGKWIMLPTNSSRGVSVDFYGYVWFVDMQTSAWRVDTEAETWEAYAGLNSPYTYSDMTGWGLSLASGGIPQG